MGAKHDDRCRRALGAQRQAATGGEVDAFVLAPEFEQHAPEAAAERAFSTSAQGGLHGLGAHEDDVGGIKPQCRKTGWIGAAQFDLQRGVPNPEQRSVGDAGALAEGERVPACRREMGVACPKHLMHGGARQAAGKVVIQTGVPQAERAVGRRAWRMPFEPGDEGAQSLGGGWCGRHVLDMF